MSKHGHTDRLVALQRGRSIAPAGCAEESLMTNRRSGINGWRLLLKIVCMKMSNQTNSLSRFSGASLFLTTCLTITGTGAGGNNGDKSAKEHFFRNRTRRKCPNGNRKEVLKRFGSRMPWVQVPPLRPFRVFITDLSNGHSLFCEIAGDTGLLRLVPPALFCYAGSGAGCSAGAGTGRYSTATP